MPGHGLLAGFGAGEQVPGGTAHTVFWVAFILAVTVLIGGAVFQRLILRADDAVVILIIHIFVLFMPSFHGLRPFIRSGKNSVIAKYFLADMRRFAGGVRHDGLNFREMLCHLVINVIKGHAVVYVAGSYNRLQNIAVYIADRVGLVGEAPLVVSLAEYPTLRVCRGDRYRFLPLLRLLPPGQLFPRCVIPPFCLLRQFVIIKGLFPWASRSAFTSAISSFRYRAAAAGTSSLIFLLIFALALICVPSINTAAGDSAPTAPASSNIHRNIASIISSVNRCRKL